MPIITINNFAQGGVNSDISPWDLDPSFMTHGTNFRIVNGKVRSFGGHENLSNCATDFNPGYLQYVSNEDDDYWLVAGNDKVFAFDGVTWTDISNTAGYTSIGADQELWWSGCRLGQIPIINNRQHYPEYWSPQNTYTTLKYLDWDAADTWATKNISCKVMRSHKSFLVALGMTENSTDYPDILRWSHPADGGSLPYTWDETDTTNLAGKSQPLGSRLIDGHSLRDAFAVYGESHINIMDYTNDEFVFRIRELSQTTGLLAARCISEVKGQHLFLADGDIVTNDGNRITSIIHKKLRNRLSANMSTTTYNRSFSAISHNTKEVWFCVPEDGADYPNVAYIYNWRDDTWSIRDIPTVAHAAYGSRVIPAQAWDDLGALSPTWDTITSVWGSRERTPLDDYVMGVDTDGQFTQLDGYEVNDGASDSVLERTDLPLEGHDVATTITRVYPHMEGTIPVDIQLGSQKLAGGPVSWNPAVSFTPGIDRKVDTRTTGSLHAWRVSSDTAGDWAISGLDIEYTKDGER